jgi:hypothetical protein
MEKFDSAINVIIGQTPKEHIYTALFRDVWSKAWVGIGPDRFEYLEDRDEIVMCGLDTLGLACCARGVAEIYGFI